MNNRVLDEIQLDEKFLFPNSEQKITETKMDDIPQGDICRVCRCEGQNDRPLFYPCVCTGSIKYIHQDCLMQWMRYSHKEYCELCGHQFSFQPIYSPDMPRVLPLRDVIGGLLMVLFKAAKSWIHFSLVGFAWFVTVPLTAYRTYRYIFQASTIQDLILLPLDVFSPVNLASDMFRGCFVVTCTLLSFIGLVWLREQILLGGGPDWLEREDAPQPIIVHPAANNVGRNQVEENAADEDQPAENANVEIYAHIVNDEPQDLIDYSDTDVARNPISHTDLTGNTLPRNNAIATDSSDANTPGTSSNNDKFDNNGSSTQNELHTDVPFVEFINNSGSVGPIPDEIVHDVPPPHEPPPSPAPPLFYEVQQQEEQHPRPDLEPAHVPDLHNYNIINNAHQNNNEVNPPLDLPFDGHPLVNVDNDNDNDDANWNPMDWDRAADDLTWERLLGLDGSLVFLEHVFWIVLLNIMLIFTFAFCPYCVGQFVLASFNILQSDKQLLHFQGLIITLFGYCFIGHILVILHFLAKLFYMKRLRNLIGFCYIVVKVSMLCVVEIGVFPLICGLWLDICSLPLFNASLKDRKWSFMTAPGTTLFVHWLCGIVYVYYFAAFIALLREILRPGVLWFLRNLNDPDFSPIQEMIHLPILRHVRRLVSSAMIFGTIVMLMLWVPIRILRIIWPSFLPYTLSNDSEFNELSLHLLLFQIILPGFVEQSHTKVWLKKFLRTWCVSVSWILGLRDYLLGQEQPQDQEQQGQDNGNRDRNENENNHPEDNNDAAEVDRVQPIQHNFPAMHHVLMQREVPEPSQPYERPTYFALRLFGLILLVCISLIITSFLILTIPIWVGRQVMSLWKMDRIAREVVPPKYDASPRPHELYTSALGTYLCWMLLRGISLAVYILPQGRGVIINKLKKCIQVCISYALPVLIIILLLGVIPLMFGLLLELVVVIPLRVNIRWTPVYFIWQDWALGVLYTKIAIALTFMGPDWQLKRALERAYRDGLRDMDLKFLICELAIPVITFFGLALSVPYVLSHSIVPLFCQDQLDQLVIQHFMYPVFFLIIGIIIIAYFQIRQLKKLYVAIKVEKYLVGQRLVNYERKRNRSDSNDTSIDEVGNFQSNSVEQTNYEPVPNVDEQIELERRRREEAEGQ